MLQAKAKLLKRFLIPGIVLAIVVAAAGTIVPGLEAWRALAPMRNAHIAYVRSPCTQAVSAGECPAYRLDVFGDGTVVYRSLGGTKVSGSYIYHVPDEPLREYIRDFSVSAFWHAPIASGPDNRGGGCSLQLHIGHEIRRNGCLKWAPGSDQAMSDASVTDSAAQLEALTRVNSLARGDAYTAELLKSAKPYAAD